MEAAQASFTETTTLSWSENDLTDTRACVCENTHPDVCTVCSALTGEHTPRTSWLSLLVQDPHCRDPLEGFPLWLLQHSKNQHVTLSPVDSID